MKRNKIYQDYHIHIGQYNNLYYYPLMILKILYKNGIKDVWVSSTTSCIKRNNNEEKQNLIHIIENEIKDVVDFGYKHKMNIVPLYWVLPQRYLDGESIKSIMDNSLYKGFKIHTYSEEWNEDNSYVDSLLNDVFDYANEHSLPVLIHTGEDSHVHPKRFEKYFSKYPSVKFVLAHCKKSEPIIDLFTKYKNVYGDIAFCPIESYKNISVAGFKNRMQIGSDFPITDWIKKGCQKKDVTEFRLNKNYKKTLKEIRKLLDK